VKFVFPNADNVYLHGTPAPALFERPRRDFSHGCIRVADPVGLAEWVLAADGNWTRDAVVAAMHGRETAAAVLQRPIPVVLFYVTAFADPDGTLRFADDIYGHDMRLDRALATLCASGSS
jgi:murein L,D-transpeptidase YcbB/YkuD